MESKNINKNLEVERMNHKAKIELTDNVNDIMRKMSEGNPGALRVCADILKHGGQIDPDSALGGFGAILSLDTHAIYSSRIWMLRAVQLGFLSDSVLAAWIDGEYAGSMTVDEIIEKVQNRLPGFKIDVAN
jgi:hypothetical protein